ncbi:disulfide bond formation protein DsbB [Xenorhabdus sp. 42]|uniref:disulfide bond formation protein DsbB n=1 Tax=Xenorhabdus szentirmaii TaxID=290112 RepID=UPI000C045415|nr:MULTISPECIES: disulfide bond formation protein DsbB [Xenorhabdus]MBD2779185.1 disulfide bond formation protein DsbB [Xenorhabdus sp. 38]MBD2792636.1 disulfide bond formation protein DsbB [Xenorhabdus sp. CUL]MBD2805787.1 disulfide bond formation protein DsbB [Xenorhabdus sp. ZM]MBD2821337.1 disulfide bond formation protein DsbB [Xenorhabdus sp. 42]MBD2826569.1 disulfide bond formation protein DsbB [Xenorhabdus sp. 5]
MFQFLKQSSQGRSAWLLMALTALILESIALYFQHIMQLQPCVMCIYERVALFGILIAALLGAIAPKTPLRWLAVLLWVYSAWQGLRLAWDHTMMQLYPSPFNTCEFFVSFPSWLPLNNWLPTVFEAYGDCSMRQWEFLTLDMPQWLIGIFAAYLLIAVLVLVSQIVRGKK